MMREGRLWLCLSAATGLFAMTGTVRGDELQPCGGLDGALLAQCQINQETQRQQQRLEQLLKQQQERQAELDKQQREVQAQQREVQQQLEGMRLQNEGLRKQLEHELANQPARPGTTDPVRNEDLKNWKADNPWFGSDYPRTQFAMRYAKQLQQERPDLAGRPLLDALSTKVNETFGAKH